MALTIAYAVFNKIYADCFVYSEMNGHCVRETLLPDTCIVMESSTPGHKSKYTLKYEENVLSVCNDLLCKYQCKPLIKDTSFLDLNQVSDCIVFDNIQISFAATKVNELIPMTLHGRMCFDTETVEIPTFSYFDAF